METILLILTTLFSGLIAGLFYAWSISVTPGLANVDDRSFLQSFQSMNRAILNPVFFIPFMGLLVLLPLTAYLHYSPVTDLRFWYITAAAVLYLVGVMAVTVAGNVPLNNELEALKISSMTAEHMQTFRSNFESSWNKLNTIRTISSALSLLLLLIALSQNF